MLKEAVNVEIKFAYLSLHTVVLVFSVQAEGKLMSVLDGFVAFEFLRSR